MGVRVVDLSRSSDNTCASVLTDFERRVARDELERLFADSRLHLTERNRAFLRYIAEVAFSGDGSSAKAYSIAVDVFGRPPSFDPSIDPIVRIEAARLRAALDHYYEAYGSPNRMRISLPRGHYIAKFSWIGDEAAAQAEIQSPSVLVAPQPLTTEVPFEADDPDRRFAGTPVMAALGAFAVACLLLLATLYSVKAGIPHVPKVTEKPLVMLLVTSRDASYDMRAANVEDDLLIALARFGTLRLATRQIAPNRPRVSMADAYRPASASPVNYQIALKYKVDETARRVTWTVIDPSSGEALSSGEEAVPNNGHDAEAADAKLVAGLTLTFGSPTGLLNSMELNRNSASEQGNVCVLRGEQALGRGGKSDLMQARACLEAGAKSAARDADSIATLARVLVALDEEAGTSANAATALTLANDAVAMAPQSDRALAARMVALYANGRSEAGEDAGEQALAANPLNSMIAGAFALRLYASGTWEKGRMLAEKAFARGDVSSKEAALVLALHCYRSNDPEAALARLDAMMDESTVGAAVRVASLVRMGRHDDAVAVLEEAELLHPQFSRLLARTLETRAFEPGLSESLLRDIAASVRS